MLIYLNAKVAVLMFYRDLNACYVRMKMPGNYDERNVLQDWMHTCPCGYSLKSAYDFLGQKEISRMLLSHIEAMHVVRLKDADL